MTKAVVWKLFPSELENRHMSCCWAVCVIVECQKFVNHQVWRSVHTSEFNTNNLSCFYQFIGLFPSTCLCSRINYEYPELSVTWPFAASFIDAAICFERDAALRNSCIFKHVIPVGTKYKYLLLCVLQIIGSVKCHWSTKGKVKSINEDMKQ